MPHRGSSYVRHIYLIGSCGPNLPFAHHLDFCTRVLDCGPSRQVRRLGKVNSHKADKGDGEHTQQNLERNFGEFDGDPPLQISAASLLPFNCALPISQHRLLAGLHVTSGSN